MRKSIGWTEVALAVSVAKALITAPGVTAQDPHQGTFADGPGLAVLLADRCTPQNVQSLREMVAFGQVTLLEDSVRIGHGFGHTWLPRIMLAPSVVHVAGLGRRHEDSDVPQVLTETQVKLLRGIAVGRSCLLRVPPAVWIVDEEEGGLGYVTNGAEVYRMVSFRTETDVRCLTDSLLVRMATGKEDPKCGRRPRDG